MNSRPLTAISEESGLVPITPAKFMCDNASCLFVPEADIVDSKFLKESHGKVQKLRETIRQRFRKEYLGFLRQNTRNKTKSIKEGDVVLMEYMVLMVLSVEIFCGRFNDCSFLNQAKTILKKI
ncbi:hypothetical protein LAZ67_17001283 [Cordylochernes scorpioides]|uniref:Uncharacterized protein n=1 Tax=Cordylochernes scorpioides TaxID=51811 RepID=A0ABY6LG21_9ARAC|nr:hypothetical protein LAZ67_17001283 [Cordylochernes scorpioides]